MEKDIASLQHTTWRCQYHVVFAPKYRRMAIYGQIRTDIGVILRKVDDEKERRDKESTNKNNKIVVGDLELDLEKVEVRVKGQVKVIERLK